MNKAEVVVIYPAKWARGNNLKSDLLELCRAYGISEPGYESVKVAGLTANRWPCTFDNRTLAESFLREVYFAVEEHTLLGESISDQFDAFDSPKIFINGESFDIPETWTAQLIATRLWQKYESQGGEMDAREFMLECMTKGGIAKAFFEEGLSDSTTPSENA